MNWAKKLVRDIGKIDDIFSENLIIGETIHYALSLIEKIPIEITKEDLIKIIKDKVRLAIKRLEIRRLQIEKLEEKIIDEIVAILQMDELKNYFLIGEVFNEKEIVDSSGNIKRMDRLVIIDNEVCVIEYKTGETYIDEHEYQIKEYIRLVKNIYKEKTVKGLLVYIDEGKIKSYN